ncbi:MAG: DUF4293 domain-containing protein [Bacteroidales bacterium]|nr:DUF4293 domain-containing protein [Bacteroidales bacterium]
MIQRIQTIWLSLIAIFSALLCFGNITSFTDNSGNELYMNFSGIFKSSANGTVLLEKTTPVSILLVAIIVMSIITILLFKKRNLQIKVTMAIIAISICLICCVAFFSFNVIKTYNAELVPGFKILVPLIIIVFAFLSYKGIKKDQDLISSYDRLR